MPADRPSLLVAEDDAEIRHLLRERLEGAGYGVRLARTGEEAIDALRAGLFRGVLLDINMPQIDGFGVLESRSLFRAFPPILMLTARHASADVQRALELGAKDYLAKPFSETQLLVRVARLVRAPARPPAPAPMEYLAI